MTRTMVLALLLALAACKKQAAFEDKVVYVDQGDPAMNEAIAQARAHVDVFARELASAGGRLYSVKKEFVDGEDAEHMWLSDVVAVGDGFEGRLDNAPEKVTRVEQGRRYTVGRDELSDWLITDPQGRMWGGYTIRAMLPSLEPAERAQLEPMLQPLP